MAEHDVPATQTSPTDRLLVLVTGSGRSGTSTIAGTLQRVGVELPGPLIAGNRSNKKGFYENRWAVDFDKKLLRNNFTFEFDGDPTAPPRVADSATPELLEELTTWLGETAAAHRQLAIKDPRSVWVHGLWTAAAEACSLRTGWLTMLRHPAEVAKSRSKYYNKSSTESDRSYLIAKVAGWVNVSLWHERQTRGQDRTFVRYTDLLADWRTTLGPVVEDLGLSIDTDLAPDAVHPVDEFIEPSLHRIRTTWDDLDVPASLRDIAEDVWDAHDRLVEAHGVDDEAQKRLDDAAVRYAALYEDAAAIAVDRRHSAVLRAERRGARRATAAARKAVAARVPDKPADKAAWTARRVVNGMRRRLRG